MCENEKFFLRKHEYRFLINSCKIENATFPYKTAFVGSQCEERRIQNGPIRRNGVLTVTAFFENFVSI